MESDAPIGICTPCGFVERELKSAYEYKRNIMQELEAALGKEANAVGVLKELIGNKDYCDFKKKDVLKAKRKVRRSIKIEEQSKDGVQESIGKLKGSLMHLGVEVE